MDYDRAKALAYAKIWALGRNPAYANFDPMGGDCTNFVSQCLFAGAPVENFTPTYGWYYLSLNDRAPAWTGVEYLFRFLTRNQAAGPYGHVISPQAVLPGDVGQLGDSAGQYYHSLLVLTPWPEIRAAAHTRDAYMRPLSSYTFDKARFIRIDGYRR